MSAIKDIYGKQFGRLKVVEKSDYTDKKQRVFWICRCECGKLIRVRGDNLRRGKSTKCTDCRGFGKPSREVGEEHAAL